ncbi:MAG TPA: hypothetical protein DCL21_03110 [Alphaproteobacteria bacterium]|nr:hypothetical protein [Alphaproteobacteria bacterium]
MKIVCLGSSSVEGIGDRKGIGWAGRLNQYLQENSKINEYRVFNLGLKGDFLSGTISRYKTEVLKRRPHLVIIFTGSNDCVTHIKDGNAIKQPNIDVYTKQWDSFLTDLSQAEHKTLILGPTMVNESVMNYKGVDVTFKNSDLEEYNKALKDLCAQHKIQFLELFDLFNGKLEELSFDFVHPNEKGYDLIFKRLITELEENNYV